MRMRSLSSFGVAFGTMPVHGASSFHRQVRNVHALADGHMLAAHEREGAVPEVDGDGKVVGEYTRVPDAPAALRLCNGDTLIACGTQKQGIEVTPAGRNRSSRSPAGYTARKMAKSCSPPGYTLSARDVGKTTARWLYGYKRPE
jgi:hypothetical protein